ncbi:MAG: rhomboid family intramembrane serine protease [Betaproteobacteria bacterium]|nr:rhomboid family intramembrane serine protease [Betaproteobacteria bacterium]
MNEQHFIELLFKRIRLPWVTLALIAINVCIFVFMVLLSGNPMRFDSRLLIAMGALFGPVTLQGQWWRMGSAIFLHGGLLHVAVNMFALWQAGGLVERLFGHRNYLLIYLGAGLCGSFASLWWKPDVLSVGASGAIFGLYGALLGFMLAEREAMPRGLMLDLRSSALTFIGFSLFSGFAMPGIDNAAHLGGLAGGVILGAGFARPLDRAERWTDLLWGLAGLLVAAGICFAALDSVRPQGKIFKAAEQSARSARAFALADEALARRTAALFEAVQRGEIDEATTLTVLQRELIPAWQAQIDRVAALPASDPLRDDLHRYAEARRNAVVALVRAIETKDRRWLDQAMKWKLQAENILLTIRLRQTGHAR